MPTGSAHPNVTVLLQRMHGGDEAATADLMPLVYGELRSLAQGLMRGERSAHTLQPTALVNEAWLRLVGSPPDDNFDSRRHFYAVAARAMRSVLVDHARSRATEKRGGGLPVLPLDEVVAVVEGAQLDLLDLHQAIERLTERDEELARVVELRFFAGLSLEETAEVVGLTVRQVRSAWALAKGLLQRELSKGALDTRDDG